MANTLLDVAAKSFAPDNGRVRQAVDALPRLETNVGDTERLVCGAVGGFLLLRALTGRSMGGLSAVAGALLLHRGLSGHCMVRQALGVSSAGPESPDQNTNAVFGAGEGVKVEQSTIVNKPADELYRFWRKYENLPKFMNHLESVTQESTRESTWTAKGPLGTRVTWRAETIHENPGEGIAWKSLPGSDVDTTGSVHFKPLAGGRTEVRVNLKYSPPAGKLGAAIARYFGEAPEVQVREDLARFKTLMESGQIATEGTAAGRK